MNTLTVPDSGEVLTHHYHILWNTGTVRTQSKTDMMTYLGG